jgi:4-amino-4-deoxy-L-arabinose transferase-like glycosyltransferase
VKNERLARLLLAGLGVLLVALRAWRIDAWPLFIDEAQHLHWAKRVWTDAPFLRPLTDGKALQVAAASLVVPFVGDPVRAGRLLNLLPALLAGFASYRLGMSLGGRAGALLALALTATSPFLVAHDRLALADPWLAALAAAVASSVIGLLGRPTMRGGIVLGVLLGAAVLAKVPGAVLLAWPAVALLLPSARASRRPLLAGLVLGALIAAAPVGYFLTHTAQLDEKIEAPEDEPETQGLLVENVGLAASWLWTSLTPPVALAALAGVGLAIARGGREPRLLVMGAALPVLTFLPAFHWFPRYILPCAVPLLVLAAWAVVSAARAVRHPYRAVAGAVAGAVLLVPCLYGDVLLVTEPRRAPLPPVDRFQYLIGWPAGVAGDAAWRRVRSEAAGRPALVVVDSAGHSTVHYVLRTRLMNDPDLEVRMSRIDSSEATRMMLAERADRQVFVVVGVRKRGRPRKWPPPELPATFLEGLVRGDGVGVGLLFRLDEEEPTRTAEDEEAGQ